ncbi:hypothetical protein COV49_03655 [Candidatus Falkowbacteria bacterium CG11_big_fil_rev_8_21_14_0_20_39_10]|uniref:DUF218 domain-containing protein n=1 Tax=Candidatus Falkowbacteria bacterium CG11_big_fil_rev_8_21_14_0_20_39_10 TaxID=1974570 RepID=A0A2M6K8B9_9BACT|nr:MAG: hypothetical protein COV49_03655 [Candidatus Falkowbacteria bacterium CG11_big_fil_rev_8_21_14_0_20_39_10]
MRIKNKKKIIVILGGDVKKEKGKWRTTNFNEENISGRLEGKSIRVISAHYLFESNPDIFIIFSGGKGIYKNIADALPVAKVMKNELIRLGVPEKKIKLEDKSNNTYEQLIKLQGILLDGDLGSVSVISNKYHLPRIKAMIEYFSELSELKKMFRNLKVELKSAEDIVIEADSNKWRDAIESVYGGEAMKKRMVKEKKGIRDIKAGKYKLKQYEKY